MYRLGLSRKRIAALVRVPPAAVGYHLAIARRQDPGLEAEHPAAAGSSHIPYPSPKDLARMNEIIAWALAEGRLPRHLQQTRDRHAHEINTPAAHQAGPTEKD